MSGLKSRRKGRTAEYAIRDAARSLGLEADRVPLSGASQGFKGDVRLRDPNTGRIQFVEAKIRKDAFKTIYADLPNLPEFISTDGGLLIHLTLDLRKAFDGPLPGSLFLSRTGVKSVAKLAGLRPLLAGSDILAIRSDRKPWIYLRYL